jgi:hypothetical protein
MSKSGPEGPAEAVLKAKLDEAREGKDGVR